jgi:hypothetical protein
MHKDDHAPKRGHKKDRHRYKRADGRYRQRPRILPEEVSNRDHAMMIAQQLLQRNRR